LEVTEPPKIVLERPAPCRDADRAEELLHAALDASRPPSAGWSVSMRVEKVDGGLLARGEIADGAGAPVAHRELSSSTLGCGGLARALGVWALLVFDAETKRMRAAPPKVDAPTPPAPKATSAPADRDEPVVAWPAPTPDEKPLPEHDWYLHHDDRRTLELGLATLLMTGASTRDAILGVSPFLVVEAGKGIFLRPAIIAGETVVAPNDPNASRPIFAAARFDTCLRVPGLYAQRRGIQLDLCGGGDLGFLYVSHDHTLPNFSLGPSVDLRGDLAGDLAVTLRGVAGLNVFRYDTAATAGAVPDTPLVAARIEIAFSWSLR
jgi:hypothetical protein